MDLIENYWRLSSFYFTNITRLGDSPHYLKGFVIFVKLLRRHLTDSSYLISFLFCGGLKS